MDSRNIEQLGEFRIVREIGRGGMGIVYEAEQIRPKRRVALTVLPVGFAPDPRALKLFEREASAAGKLSHPNIVSIHSVGQEGDTHYFVMDYVDGITLAQLIKETKLKDKSTIVASDQMIGQSSDTELTSSEEEDHGEGEEDDYDDTSTDGLKSEYFTTIVEYIIQAAEGLDHAHRRGIIHRDIKPSNLMLTNEGRVMVMDFGLAKEEDASKRTQTGRPFGTTWYMSPEQMNPNVLRVDKRADIYSLVVTLYQLLTLRLPFRRRERERALNEIMFKDPPRPCDLVPQLPVDIETITLKAMEKDPDRRYQSAREMADDLRRYLRHEPIWAKPPTC